MRVDRRHRVPALRLIVVALGAAAVSIAVAICFENFGQDVWGGSENITCWRAGDRWVCSTEMRVPGRRIVTSTYLYQRAAPDPASQGPRPLGADAPPRDDLTPSAHYCGWPLACLRYDDV